MVLQLEACNGRDTAIGRSAGAFEDKGLKRGTAYCLHAAIVDGDVCSVIVDSVGERQLRVRWFYLLAIWRVHLGNASALVSRGPTDISVACQQPNRYEFVSIKPNEITQGVRPVGSIAKACSIG